MRRFGWTAFLLGLLLLLPLAASAQGTSEQIDQFDAQITVQTDGTIDVVETILYNFGPADRHGIFREIPKLRPNKDGKDYVLDYRLQSIADEDGTAYNYVDESTSKLFKYRIGDADKTITGRHTYVITYSVSGALTYFSDHDELYWNVTGTEWEVPIASASAQITLPVAVPTEGIEVICYTGEEGSTAQRCNSNQNDRSGLFATRDPLYPYQGLTVAMRFPMGYVDVLEAAPYVDFWDTLLGKVVIGLILLVALLWFVLLPLYIIRKWFKQGRDPKVATGVTSAWFDAPESKTGRKLTPAEVGGLVDETADHPEIAATIVHLAQQGYLKISETKKNKFTLTKTEGPSTETLLTFEKTLLAGLFGSGTTCNLKGASLVTAVANTKKQIYQQLVAEGYFPKDPSKIRNQYAALGVIAMVTLNIPLAIVAFTFGRNMAAKTVAGTEAANVAKSLRNFLGSQERTLEHQAKTQAMFEKLLPYAIAFRVEGIWAKRFDDLQMEPSDWYDSYDHNRLLRTHILASSLGHAVSQVRAAATPVSSSTGHSSGFSGGSSGGGGGGGGGGSW